MFTPITSPSPHGVPFSGGAAGLVPVVGPLVTLAFVLPMAGPVPSDLELDPPQSCQPSTPNVAIQVAVVDQDGAAVDLSEATALQFWLLAPDGTPRPVPAAFASNGLDGLLEYVTTAEDLPQTGLWNLQAQMTFRTQILLTRIGKFSTTENIA